MIFKYQFDIRIYMYKNIIILHNNDPIIIIINNLLLDMDLIIDLEKILDHSKFTDTPYIDTFINVIIYPKESYIVNYHQKLYLNYKINI